MIHVTYHHLHDSTGKVIGYRVEACDPNSGEVFEQYTAANSPWESTAFTDGPEALGFKTLAKYARQTAKEIAEELQVEYPHATIVCF